MKGDEAINQRAKRSERAHAGDYANERSISDLPPDFIACPTHLPINSNYHRLVWQFVAATCVGWKVFRKFP